MDEKSRNSLWEEYMRTRSPQIRGQLIIEYSGLVKIVAGRLGMYLGYTVEYDDLVGYGIFGLIDACLLYTSDAADEANDVWR